MLRMVETRRLFKKANKILDNMGGEYCSFMGVDTPSFDGFEMLYISRKEVHAGELPGKKITIETEGEVFFLAEKIEGFPLETIIFRPGNWQKILDDEFYTGKK